MVNIQTYEMEVTSAPLNSEYWNDALQQTLKKYITFVKVVFSI